MVDKIVIDYFNERTEIRIIPNLCFEGIKSAFGKGYSLSKEEMDNLLFYYIDKDKDQIIIDNEKDYKYFFNFVSKGIVENVIYIDLLEECKVLASVLNLIPDNVNETLHIKKEENEIKECIKNNPQLNEKINMYNKSDDKKNFIELNNDNYASNIVKLFQRFFRKSKFD